MAMRIHLFTQKTRDLQCGHSTRWAGALEGHLGQHLIALDCAVCVSREAAQDSLNQFALYVHLTSTENADEVKPAVKMKKLKFSANGS